MSASLRRLLPCVLTAALGLVLAAPVAARKAWDQETVSSLVAQLSKATGQLSNTVRKEPHIQDAIRHGDRHAQAFWDAIDGLDRSARQLAARTRKGGGYEDTMNIAKKIRMQVRDAEVAGARVMSSAFMEKRIVPVQALLDRLAPYYF